MALPVDRYRFEIEPWLYATDKGTAKVLKVSMEVNGEPVVIQKVIDGVRIPSWQSELAYYSHLATLSLEEWLKKKEEKDGTQ